MSGTTAPASRRRDSDHGAAQDRPGSTKLHVVLCSRSWDDCAPPLDLLTRRIPANLRLRGSAINVRLMSFGWPGAILFDFDGVIMDSEPLHLRAFQDVLRDEGIELSDQEYYRELIG